MATAFDLWLAASLSWNRPEQEGAAIEGMGWCRNLAWSAARWLRGWPTTPRAAGPAAPHLSPLRRLVLADQVCRTIFEEFAEHRAGERGEVETGWSLLGVRDTDSALVLATLPAGAECSADESHVQFNSAAQALGSRIVRQNDRRLTMLGIVHTHPGRLRHPSQGDYRADREWVGLLRGGEGVFGIGTADAPAGQRNGIAWQPKPHRQCLGPLSVSWYSLGSAARRYRRLPVSLTIGPDLARGLRPVWGVIEEHAERIERLVQQQAEVRFDVVDGKRRPALRLTIPLASGQNAVQVLLEGKEVRFFWERDGELQAADLGDVRVDQGFYMLLAELSGRD